MCKELMMNVYKRFNVIFEKGEGTYLFDTENEKYIDFVSGIAVNALGHSHKQIIDTIKEQSSKLMHISNLYWNEPALNLAHTMIKNSHHHQVFFCNSGTEAIEAAIKLGRKYGKNIDEEKNEIIYMKNSFHGRTCGALAVTGQYKYQKDFYPLMKGVKEAIFNDLEDIKMKINQNTCAIIIEPIQGEGGIIVAQKDYLKGLRELCDEHNVLLIFDEVQCGIGRCGTLFAYESFGVIPDIVCMAKGLGGGFPIGAVMANEKSSQAFVPGDHGNTFGGNPLGCSVAHTVLEILIKDVIKDVQRKNLYMIEKLEKLKESYTMIKSIQGMGLMLGIKVSIDPKIIVNKCLDHKLLVIGAGKDVVRMLPPLTVTLKEIDEALNILEKVLKEITIS